MAQRWIATSPDDLSLVEYDVPPPGPAEVTVAVHAAGVGGLPRLRPIVAGLARGLL